MKADLSSLELPEFATLRERLRHSIEAVRDAVSLRVGYEVELAGLEPVERDSHFNMRVYWRRKVEPSRTTH